MLLCPRCKLPLDHMETVKQWISKIDLQAVARDYALGLSAKCKLTRTEMRTVLSLLEGLGNKEIAKLHGTTEQVVKNRFRYIFNKTGASDRVELVLMILLQRNASNTNHQ